MAIKTRKRKKTRKHYRRGYNMAKHVSLSGGYRKFSQCFHDDVEKKECASIIKGWVKGTFNKETAKNILRNEEWRWNRNQVAAYCYWTALEDAESAEKSTIEWMNNFFAELAERGKVVRAEEKKKNKTKKTGYTPTLQERTRDRLSEIIGEFEFWLDKQPNEDIPKFFDWLKKENIAQAHIGKIRSYYEPVFAEYQELLKKECPPDLKEGYNYLNKVKIKTYVKFFEVLFADLAAYNNIKKIARKTRVRKAPSKEKLVSKLKYKPNEDRYKIASINPIDILDATELWIFNTKNRKLGKYVAEQHCCLSVKGTTLLNFNSILSIQKTIRRPEEKLVEFSKSGKVTLRKFLSEIKATETKLNGRLNKHTILLKVS